MTTLHDPHDTIAAPATAPGGAIALIRVSGPEALVVCGRIFKGRIPLTEAAPNTVHYGRIIDGERIIDDVLATVFRAPHSYTGEDSAELSCHGSPYITSEILRLLTEAGARMAQPGEFTTRAFLAGKMDLAQAEAVADLIASSSRASHALASNQMRGGFSTALHTLRDELLQLSSLLELELDFSEEDVEFADRSRLRETMRRIGSEIDGLRNSFSLGNALKRGIPVAIVGAPNVGKSTLLNRLLGEDRAMVSDIAGTTRDVIEDTTDIDGVLFRFIDTAGIRTTDDRLERMGIERTYAAAEQARIIIRLTDAAQWAGAAPGYPAHSASSHPSGTANPEHETAPTAQWTGTAPGHPAHNAPAHLSGATGPEPEPFPTNPAPKPVFPGTFTAAIRPEQQLLEVVNKTDLYPHMLLPAGAIGISARQGNGIEALRQALHSSVDTESLYHGDTVISSARHYEALTSARKALDRAATALEKGRSADLLSEDIREVLYHLGTITGEITTEEILGNIFSKFCIGK